MKHGLHGTRVYSVWLCMMHRCYRPDHDSYKHYGARGIRVCSAWHDVRQFAADMGNPPEGHQIDRIDSDGNYEPGNCRWVDAKTNSRNRSNTHMVTWRGETKPLAEWAEALGMPREQLSTRLRRGWSVDDALGTPFRSYERKAA